MGAEGHLGHKGVRVFFSFCKSQLRIHPMKFAWAGMLMCVVATFDVHVVFSFRRPLRAWSFMSAAILT